MCLRDLNCYPVWQWPDWRGRPVVFQAHLCSPLVRSYNQCGLHRTSHRPLSKIISRRPSDFVWWRSSIGAPPRHIASSSRACVDVMEAAKGVCYKEECIYIYIYIYIYIIVLCQYYIIIYLFVVALWCHLLIVPLLTVVFSFLLTTETISLIVNDYRTSFVVLSNSDVFLTIVSILMGTILKTSPNRMCIVHNMHHEVISTRSI